MEVLDVVRRGEFSTTQRGRKTLHYLGHLFHKNKNIKISGSEEILVLWECERRREMRCPVYVTTDEDGVIVKDVKVAHIHEPPAADRAAMLTVRHRIIEEGNRRPEASPASLLNEFVTPAVALHLGDERTLKRAIQRKRKTTMPVDPPSATNIVIAEAWKVTLDGKE